MSILIYSVENIHRINFSYVVEISQKIRKFFILDFKMFCFTFIRSIVKHSTKLTGKTHKTLLLKIIVTFSVLQLLLYTPFVKLSLHFCVNSFRIISHLIQMFCHLSIQNAGADFYRKFSILDSRQMLIISFFGLVIENIKPKLSLIS